MGKTDARRRTLAVVALLALASPADALPTGPRHWDDVGRDLPDEPLGAVAIDPTDDAVILVGMDGFVFKSDDGGDTWRPVLSFPRGLAIERTAADVARPSLAGESVVAEAGGGAIPLTSIVPADDDAALGAGTDDDPTEDDDEAFPDGDADFDGDFDGDDAATAAARDDEDVAADDLPEGEAVDPADPTLPRLGPGVRVIRFVKESPGTVWVATARGLYRSVDRGERFARIELPGGAEANDVRDLVVDPLRPSRLYLATARGLLVTRDGATTFAAAPGRAGETPAIVVAADGSEGETQVLVGTQEGLLRSWDAGATFLDLLLAGAPHDEPITALAFAVDGAVTYAGTRTGLWASERRAAILEPRDATAGDAVLAVSPDPRAARGVAVGYATSGVRLSPDTGLTVLERQDVLPAGRVAALARERKDTDAILAAADRGLFRSSPGTGVRREPDRLKRLRARFAAEPDAQLLVDAALGRAGLRPGAADDMLFRARWSALLPVLELRYRFETGRRDDRRVVVIFPGDTPPVFDPDIEDPEQFGDGLGVFELGPSTGTLHQGFLVARWDLERLVFDEREVVVARVAPILARGREQIADRVVALALARRRLLVQIAMGDDAPTPKRVVARRVELQELTAQIDGMTGGALTDGAAKNGVDASSVNDLVEEATGRRRNP